MLKKFKNYIALVSFLAFLMSGCVNTSQNQNSVQIKNETEETKSLMIPQYELVETPKYKELKKQVEKTRNEVYELESKKNKLEIIYTKEYSPLKKISKNFEEAKIKLVQLEKLLDEETEKLEKRPINSSV